MFAPHLVVLFHRALYDLALGTILTVYMINIGENVEGSFVETRKGAGRARGCQDEMRWGTEHSCEFCGLGGNGWTLLFVLGSGGKKCRAFGSVRESVVYLRDLSWGLFGHSSPLSPDFLSIVGLFFFEHNLI